MNRSVKETKAHLNGLVADIEQEGNDSTAMEVRSRLQRLGSRNRKPLNRLIVRAEGQNDTAESRTATKPASHAMTLEAIRKRLAA
jgi:hypothetical protein